VKLYCGIDLHSNNHYVVIIDEQDKRLLEVRLSNELSATLKALEPYKSRICGVAVESTFNWYWLVDGLQEAGYPMMLVNTYKAQQYSGLKRTDDRHDAFWLAHQMRLGILPLGYIYPKEGRGLRDLLRERRRLVRQRTTHALSVQSTVWRHTAVKVPGQVIIGRRSGEWPEVSDSYVEMGINAHRQAIIALTKQIKSIERTVVKQLEPMPSYKMLLTVPGIGPIIAWTIVLESGDLSRFAGVGNYASYCRCVDATRTSNDKKKSENNAKNGNRYLSWAYFEAAHFAIQFMPAAKRFYEKKKAQRNPILAMKALSHKLARASYFVMRDLAPFDETRLFS